MNLQFLDYVDQRIDFPITVNESDIEHRRSEPGECCGEENVYRVDPGVGEPRGADR